MPPSLVAVCVCVFCRWSGFLVPDTRGLQTACGVEYFPHGENGAEFFTPAPCTSRRRLGLRLALYTIQPPGDSIRLLQKPLPREQLSAKIPFLRANRKIINRHTPPIPAADVRLLVVVNLNLNLPLTPYQPFGTKPNLHSPTTLATEPCCWPPPSP